MALAHSRFLPDEAITLGKLPTLPVSGLVGAYDSNLLDPVEDPLTVVHPKNAGYTIDPLDLFLAPSGTPMMPWPMNYGIPTEQFTYWTWRDYLGIGAGAHGFARRAGGSEAWAMRYANLRLPESYMSAPTDGWSEKRELIGRDAAISEFVMLGLRLLDGLSLRGFEATFGCEFEQAIPEFSALRDAGFIEEENERVRLTRSGLMIGDSIISRLAASVLPG